MCKYYTDLYFQGFTFGEVGLFGYLLFNVESMLTEARLKYSANA
jgi:hypothetical protein